MTLVTVTQAAALACKDASNVRRAILAGKLQATKYGKTWLISEDELQRWLDDDSAHKRGRKPAGRE